MKAAEHTVPDPDNPLMRAAVDRFNSAVRNPDNNAEEIDAALVDFRVEQAAGTTGLQFVPLDTFVVRPAVSWLVRDLIPTESIVVVFGPPKSGKTYAVSDMVMHAVHGMHWHGHTISRALRGACAAVPARCGGHVNEPPTCSAPSTTSMPACAVRVVFPDGHIQSKYGIDVYTALTYISPMFTVIETPTFTKLWPDYWGEDERGEFVAWLVENPEAGDVIKSSGGCRKVRWGRPGAGKRGGVRVIHYNRLADGVIYLLLIYAKGVRDDVDAKLLDKVRRTIDG